VRLALSALCSLLPAPSSQLIPWSFGLVYKCGSDAKTQDAPPMCKGGFGQADVFVGIICGRTGHRRSLEANGVD
jgi:hypothetical protein